MIGATVGVGISVGAGVGVEVFKISRIWGASNPTNFQSAPWQTLFEQKEVLLTPPGSSTVWQVAGLIKSGAMEINPVRALVIFRLKTLGDWNFGYQLGGIRNRWNRVTQIAFEVELYLSHQAKYACRHDSGSIPEIFMLHIIRVGGPEHLLIEIYRIMVRIFQRSDGAINHVP